MQRYGADAAGSVLGVFLSTVGLGALLIIIPVVTAYILLEAETIKSVLIVALPRGWRPRALKIGKELDEVVGGFVRGQLIVAAIIGVVTTVFLLITHGRSTRSDRIDRCRAGHLSLYRGGGGLAAGIYHRALYQWLAE